MQTLLPLLDRHIHALTFLTLQGAIESVSVGEIRLSLRQSLVKLFGFISKDPKLQVLICDLEVVMRPSGKSTRKIRSQKARSSGNSGRGKWMVVANMARFLSVSISDLVLKVTLLDQAIPFHLFLFS